jgi:hypothetical protein
MVVADLHVHTDSSDGTLALAEVPAAAREADVEVVAITDHDRLADLPRPVVHREGVTLVSAIELRVDAGFGNVDLLGYAARPTEALAAECERIQRDRVERARRIVDLVERETGVDLDVPFEPGVGRPHIARAIEASDADYDFAGAFEQLIGDDGPCYVARDVPTFERGRELLAAACGLVGLAHPLRYDDPEAALALCESLEAVEYRYSYGREVDSRPVERAIEAHDLVPTGGSDAHGRELGIDGLSRAEYRAFRERVELSPNVDADAGTDRPGA